MEGANVAKGGWVGGDAWFGSVMSAVEVFNRFGVYRYLFKCCCFCYNEDYKLYVLNFFSHSTFIIKNNQTFFPMRVLHDILKSRHGDHPAGHWVVMLATISQVRVLAIEYAWSQ